MPITAPFLPLLLPGAPPTQATGPGTDSLTPGEPDLHVREVTQTCPEKFLGGTQGLEADCSVRDSVEGTPWPWLTGALGQAHCGLCRGAGLQDRDTQNDRGKCHSPRGRGISPWLPGAWLSFLQLDSQRFPESLSMNPLSRAAI